MATAREPRRCRSPRSISKPDRLCGCDDAGRLQNAVRPAWQRDPDDRRAARLENQWAVFPGLQTSPIFQNIAAMAVGLTKITQSEELRKPAPDSGERAPAGCETGQRGIPIAYGGTNWHLVVIDLNNVARPAGNPLSSNTPARILNLAHMVCNECAAGRRRARRRRAACASGRRGSAARAWARPRFARSLRR